jgi:LysM repeat protein
MDLPFPRSPRRHRICVPGTFFLSLALFSATAARSQDMAEAARQERAKKDAQQKKSKHVYTNDDLKHRVILTPEDQEQAQAAKNRNVSPGEKPAEASATSVDAQTAPAEIPLGEVARTNRQQKFLQQLARERQSAQFHLPSASAPLASPKPPVFPAAKAPGNSITITRPPERPSAEIQPLVHLRRRSPFDRTIVPASPAIRPALKAPSMPIANSNLQPVAPTASAPAANIAVVVPVPERKMVPKAAVVSAAPKPATPEGRIVVARPGDSLWKLAQQNLGAGLRWPDLLAANPNIADPNRIATGLQIVVPAKRMVARRAADSLTHIKVQKGDSLWTLAETHFGRAAAWTCIAQANPLLRDPNRIIAGQELLLPSSCSASLVASQK